MNSSDIALLADFSLHHSSALAQEIQNSVVMDTSIEVGDYCIHYHYDHCH